MDSRPTPVADLPPAEQEAIARAEAEAIPFGEQGHPNADSSPEFVTDDELFGYNDDADETLVEAALREYGLDGVESLPEVGEDLVDVDESAEVKRVLKHPGDPTAEEYEAHRVDHLPYRSWCPHCVAGKATGRQHRSIRDRPLVPQFGFDYMHSSDGNALGMGEEEIVKILVAKCHHSKCVFAHVVPQKGLDPTLYAVERLKRDVMWLGHTKLVLKSDNERAILALLRSTLRVLQKEVNIENIQESHPAAYDP